MTRLFGTDGVRGVANKDLTPDLALRLARACALDAVRTGRGERPVVVVGRDTRCSGPMLEAAVVAGLTSGGCDAGLLGIVPTPAVAAVVARTKAAAGIVISASHNPVDDNGIKIFGEDGFKLSDDREDEIERLAEMRHDERLPVGSRVGTVRDATALIGEYEEALLDGAVALDGMHVVVDAAYGAAYAVAPRILRRLGAVVEELHCAADGTRINVACGTTDLRALRVAVAAHGGGALGVAFDGDADRALFVDETGAVVDGDHVLLILARWLHARGALPGARVIGTVMSNLGLEHALAKAGITLERAPVGDRFVLERMRATGAMLGGEQSGHVIDLHRSTTGDGLMTAVRILGIVAESGRRLHELAGDLVPLPQMLVNVPASDRTVLERDEIRRAINEAQAVLGDEGRILIRPSGTELLIRIMAEGPDQGQIERVVATLAERIAALACDSGKEIERAG